MITELCTGDVHAHSPTVSYGDYNQYLTAINAKENLPYGAAFYIVEGISESSEFQGCLQCLIHIHLYIYTQANEKVSGKFSPSHNTNYPAYLLLIYWQQVS